MSVTSLSLLTILAALLASLGCSRDNSAVPSASASSEPKSEPPDPKVAAFAKWVAVERSRAPQASRDTICYPADNPNHGWCDGMCAAPAGLEREVCTVRYWKDDPRAARFDLFGIRGDVACTDFAKSNRREDYGSYVGCKMNDGPLRGMRAKINQLSAETLLILITPEFVEHEPDLGTP